MKTQTKSQYKFVKIVCKVMLLVSGIVSCMLVYNTLAFNDFELRSNYSYNRFGPEIYEVNDQGILIKVSRKENGYMNEHMVQLRERYNEAAYAMTIGVLFGFLWLTNEYFYDPENHIYRTIYSKIGKGDDNEEQTKKD